MKKIVFTSTLFLLSSLSFSCQVVLINSGDQTVEIKDLNAPKKPFRPLDPGAQTHANFDPDTHARLLIKIGPAFYSVQQHACSKSHEIPLTVEDILSENGGNLLTITKGKSTIHKDQK